jgi:hypothetical protein
MNRQLFALVAGIVLCASGFTQAAVYDEVYWVGPDGEWTGDVTASPEYSVGWWSTNPNATSGVPAKYAFGRNDGIRVGEVIGNGGFDLDRVPCGPGFPCSPDPGGAGAGIQLGTDIFINNGATVTYNPNRMFLTGDDGLDRFGDWRIQPNPSFPGTPTLNLSNGSKFVHQTTFGGDIDGMWTRWNGAELNLDGEGTAFQRTGDAANGFASGAFMFASYHGYPNSVQHVNITNGARFENQGQVWFGISGFDNGEENQPGIDVIVTINGGHMDMTGGDEYALDNDNFLSRADLAFIYDWTFDDDPEDPSTLENNETYVINFTGPGTITVDGEIEDPIDELDGTYTQAEIDEEFGAGRGGIRIAMARGTGQFSTRLPAHAGHELQEYGPEGGELNEERNIQRSYEDLWDLGILQAKGKSGLTGHDFDDFFDTENDPGENNYKLISLVVPGLPGDFNEDGTVDAADYVMWAKIGGNPLPNDEGAATAAARYDLWVDNFGNSESGSGGGSVPEPGTLLLTLFGLASLSVWRKRAN